VGPCGKEKGAGVKLTAVCCTFHRPFGLGILIESFLRQDYPKELRELVILDDAGQYDNQTGEGWRLVSVPCRFNSLGEKRNACAAIASPDTQGFLVADDDDIYLPHWFSTQAAALKQADWSRPGIVLVHKSETELAEQPTGGLYHGGWAFRREAFYRVHGYGPYNNGEDQEFAARLKAAGVSEIDPSETAPPFYIYVNHNHSYHLSHMGNDGYGLLGQRQADKVPLRVSWPMDFSALPVQRKFCAADGGIHQDNKRKVTLIGPIAGPGGDGPSNGMSALQAELRKRIDRGLDWFEIRSLPAPSDSLAWFWNWNDRDYARWWNKTGRPFVLGPNVMFYNSATPRCDRLEADLLDAKHCKAMFCHTPWYRNLLAKHKGADNQAEIHLWPYPIDPMPGPPLPAKYDLLIYGKNGYRPGLLEFLAEQFPNHVQIHYGRYKRDELYEAARQSRACAYLADDDHGPLALQEILLAGCPAVGVRTGASFITDGATGFYVDRLPPAPTFASRDDDRDCLSRYLQTLGLAMTLNREAVSQFSRAQFDTSVIVDRLLTIFDDLRGR
jgi:glycosyltransferase involved in cell wall biosynthesis